MLNRTKEIAMLLAQGKTINNASVFGHDRLLKLNVLSELLETKKNCTIVIRQLRHDLRINNN